MCAGIRAGVEVWALIGKVSCALLLLHEAAGLWLRGSHSIGRLVLPCDVLGLARADLSFHCPLVCPYYQCHSVNFPRVFYSKILRNPQSLDAL